MYREVGRCFEGNAAIMEGNLCQDCREHSPPCEHKDFRRDRVMDMEFFVCRDCNFQWKKV